MSKRTAPKYAICRDGHPIFSARDYDLVLLKLRHRFIFDAEKAFEQGCFIADKNGIPIRSDDDGEEYTQEEISKMDEWPGGEYVFPEDFTSYRDQDRKLVSVEEETIEREYDND